MAGRDNCGDGGSDKMADGLSVDGDEDMGITAELVPTSKIINSS